MPVGTKPSFMAGKLNPSAGVGRPRPNLVRRPMGAGVASQNMSMRPQSMPLGILAGTTNPQPMPPPMSGGVNVGPSPMMAPPMMAGPTMQGPPQDPRELGLFNRFGRTGQMGQNPNRRY